MNKPSFIQNLSLQMRLLFAFLLVMAVCLTVFFVVGWLVAPQFFEAHLDQLAGAGANLTAVREDIEAGFDFAWTMSAVCSLIVGLAVAGLLSLYVSRRIFQPLVRLSAVADQFATGRLQVRTEKVGIPEIDALGRSFNEMAESLQDVERRRLDLIGDLTHELRTPLTVLGGYLEGITDGSIDGSPELFERLNREILRLRRLVNDLQELSRVEAGAVPLHLQEVQLASLVEEVIETVRMQVPEEGPLLTSRIAPTAPPVYGDPDRIRQVLINLLGNAVRYTPEGQITVTCQISEKSVRVAVQDTGIGIADADLSHVFDRFWRADRSRSRSSGGSGIGLTIVRQLVERHGGAVEVHSRLGAGSTFAFTLPRYLAD